MILAVQKFNVGNFKKNSTNYDAKSNTISRIDNSKSVADSFNRSNQIAFRGSLAKLGENVLGDAGTKLGGAVRKAGEGLLEKAGAKLTGVTRTVGEELSGAAETKLTDIVGTAGEEFAGSVGTEIGALVPKNEEGITGVAGEALETLAGTRELPFVETPVISPSVKGERDAALSTALDKAKSRLKEMLDRGDIDRSKYNSKVDEFTSYFNRAKNLDAKTNNSSSIISGQPSFRGGVDAADVDATGIGASDVGDAASEVVGEGAKEAAKSVATEVGTYVAEEVVGEAAMQFVERAIDVGAPGVGLAITGIRYYRRAKKVGELGEKVAKSDTVQGIVDGVSGVVGKRLDEMVAEEMAASSRNAGDKRKRQQDDVMEPVEREMRRTRAKVKLACNIARDSEELGFLGSLGKNLFGKK